MRTLILGDIHSNLIALQAVLADAEERGGFDQVWCLGDTGATDRTPGPVSNCFVATPCWQWQETTIKPPPDSWG